MVSLEKRSEHGALLDIPQWYSTFKWWCGAITTIRTWHGSAPPKSIVSKGALHMVSYRPLIHHNISQPIHAAGDLMGLRWFMVQVRLNTVDLNMAMMAPMNPALDMIFWEPRSNISASFSMASVASLKAIRMMDYIESFGYKWPAIPQLFQFTSTNPGRGIKELRRKGCPNN